MRHGESDGKQIRIVLIALGIAMFLAVVGSGYRAIEANSPDVLNNCIKNGALESVKNVSDSISSESDARNALQTAIGENATFLYNTVDACDVQYTGYVYKSESNKTYAVCGDGKIFAYADLCGKNGRWDSLVSMVSTKKEGAAVSNKSQAESQ